MAHEVSNYLINYLAPASAALATLVAYLAVYRNSQPQVVVYYQPSERQQSIIELVIENIGTGNAFDIKFSKPIPIRWFGIKSPSGDGSYIPESGIPSLAPRQRLVFLGGQFAGLSKELQKNGELRSVGDRIERRRLAAGRTTAGRRGTWGVLV